MYKEFRDNQILKYEGCFGLHQVANARESRLYERTSLESHTFKATGHCQYLYWVGSGWADSLLSLAFTT